MSEANAPDIIEMRRSMNPETRKKRLDAAVRLVQEWKVSGMTQVEFAASKGMSVRALEYRIRKVRDLAPETITDEALAQVTFARIPTEYVAHESAYGDSTLNDQPVLMVQASVGCLQATNGIEPSLLKMAMEVMLQC